jgi:hypothetical protein
MTLKQLGTKRPSQECGIYFQGKRSWTQKDFNLYLGIKKMMNNNWWETFENGATYLQLNCKDDIPRDCPIVVDFISEMRKTDWGFDLGSDLFDKAKTCIILIGNIKPYPTRTKWHVDWARARNWGVLLKVSSY